MRYNVHWTPDAEHDLARLWLEADDRDEISRVTNQIDAALREDAHLQGESREDISRILFYLPFAVEFAVLQPTRTVFVTGLWKCKRP